MRPKSFAADQDFLNRRQIFVFIGLDWYRKKALISSPHDGLER